MAKDPAFLFYPNDWLGGTTGMTLTEKGAYMELLVMQFNKGAFTKDQAKKLLNGHFEELWAVLSEKFTELDGKFLNKRLEEEKLKRENYLHWQSENGKKGGRPKSQMKAKQNPPLKPNESQTISQTKARAFENENISKEELLCISNDIVDNEVVNNSKSGKNNQFPDESDLNLELPEIKIGACIELFRISKGIDASREKILGFWSVFKNQNFTGKKYYSDVGDIHSHFINWLKSQNISHGTNKTSRERQNAASAAVSNDLKKALEFINRGKADNSNEIRA